MLDELREQLQNALGGGVTIERELGGGGMSRVFLATDRSLNRAIVIKTLPPELASPSSLERFRLEIEVAARLQHPHIVALIAAGVVDAAPYYTMPFVEGETLRDRLHRGPMPIGEVVQILREVADALSYAHGRGVVHRDIKPENILIANRHALVTDFGVAKALAVSRGGHSAGDQSTSALTAVGTSIGTPAYMSPEQISADPDTDHRSDLYSLGIVGYEMLVGTPPFHGMAASKILAAHVTTAPTAIQQSRPDVPHDLAALLVRCLAKAPEDRPATAAAVLAELETIGTGTAPKRRRRSRMVMFGMVAAVAALALTVLLVPRNVWAMLTVLAARPSATLRPNRVIVAPLRNETGDPTLDHFGDYASDQVAVALTRLKALTVMDSRTAVLNDRIVKRVWMLSWFRGSDRAIADQTGSGMVVAGAYYKDGNLLRIHVKITDFATGKIIQPLGEISGTVDSKEALAVKLAQHVYGTMAQALDSIVTTPFGAYGNPPSVEAFTEMMNGFLAYVTFDTSFATHFRAAMALDSEYATPVVLLALAATFREQHELAESALVRATQLADKMTPVERALLDHVSASLNADARAIGRTAKRMIMLAPGSLEVPLQAAGAALCVGDPNAAVAALALTDPNRGLNLVSPYYWRHLGDARHQLGEHEVALKAIRAGLARFGSDAPLAEKEAVELVDLGRDGELDRAIERGGSAADRLSIAAGAVDALGAHGRATVAKHVAERWIEKIDAVTANSPVTRYNLARLRAAAQLWDSVRVALRPLLVGQRDLVFRDALTLDAIAALHLNDAKPAEQADSVLATFTGRYDYGRALVHRAEIAAQRGDMPRVAALLTMAMQKGYGLQNPSWLIETNPYLEALRDSEWFNGLAIKARFAH